MSQEKLQTMVMQMSWGVIGVYYEIKQVVNGKSAKPRKRTSAELQEFPKNSF